MSERDRGRSHRDREVRDRDRDRDLDRDRHRDRDRDRRRDDDDRDRKDRERSKRSRTPDRARSRRRSHTRSRSPDRSGRRHHRTPSPEQSRKRQKRGDDEDKDRKRTSAVVSDFVDGIAKDRKSKKGSSVDRGSAEPGAGGGGVDGEMDADEIEMMKMMGIPVGFDSTKGKHVPGTDLSGVRAVTKRQPRQYMNRRGGFNRPLPAETNR